LIQGKLPTPKNIRFNELIKFLNIKYSLIIPEKVFFSGYGFQTLEIIVGLQDLLKLMAILV